MFIKITLCLAISIHSFKFTVVLLSSSIIPSFTVFSGKLKILSTSENKSQVNFTSSGPCILGFTIYILFVFEFLYTPLPIMSCMAIHTVKKASIIPSGTSLPFRSLIAGLVIKCPTFLTNMRLLPGSSIIFPFFNKYFLSGLSSLVMNLPPLSKDLFKLPFIKPSQFL